jgi:electron transfer flavoprotein alpha subunit
VNDTVNKDIHVVVETLRGEILDITYAMLAAGRELADATGGKLTAVLVGQQADGIAGTLGMADAVVQLEHPLLEVFNPEAHVAALAACCEEPPRLLLLASGAAGTDLACSMGQRWGVPVVSSCRRFLVNSDQVMFSSLVCGGKIVATGRVPEPCCIVTVMPGGYPASAGRVDGGAAPEIKPVTIPDDLRTRFVEYVEPQAGDVDIAREDVLVAVGRGVQTKDNVALAEELAEALGGSVAGSRPVVDQAWLPSSRLVGKSGKQVKPKLYLALGISGAPEHMEGLAEPDLLVAVNTDEKAPIFDAAAYGALVDAVELMPVLTEKLKVSV